jgi:hypothetical protein
MYASKQEIKAAIKALRAKGSEASFSAAGCSFDMPKSTAIGLLKQRINIAEEGEEHDLPSFNVSIHNFEGVTCVYIRAGCEAC